MEIPSLRILIKTTPVIAMLREYFIRYLIRVRVKIRRMSCSVMLEKVVGNIFSLPKK